jgi:hypothetical protein
VLPTKTSSRRRRVSNQSDRGAQPRLPLDGGDLDLVLNPEEELGAAHQTLSSAGFYLVTMLVKRRMSQTYLMAAITQVKSCLATLEKLLEYATREK